MGLVKGGHSLRSDHLLTGQSTIIRPALRAAGSAYRLLLSLAASDGALTLGFMGVTKLYLYIVGDYAETLTIDYSGRQGKYTSSWRTPPKQFRGFGPK
jgi:hypothetical protein